MKRIIFAFLTVLPLMCGAQTTDKDFVKGADVGFLAGQERQGVVFHDRNGRQRECLEMRGKFDMVGMSLYPYWAMDGHPELNADDIITDCIKNIRHVSGKYNCDVMIVETGYEVDERHPEKMEEGRRQLARVIREARHETDGHCRGVFYWEPQCLPGGYKLGAFDSKAAPTVIMDGFIE